MAGIAAEHWQAGLQRGQHFLGFLDEDLAQLGIGIAAADDRGRADRSRCDAGQRAAEAFDGTAEAGQ